MKKKDILKKEGLTEEEFYKKYPTKEAYESRDLPTFRNGGNIPKYYNGGYYNPNNQGGYYNPNSQVYTPPQQQPGQWSKMAGMSDVVAGVINPLAGLTAGAATQAGKLGGQKRPGIGNQVTSWLQPWKRTAHWMDERQKYEKGSKERKQATWKALGSFFGGSIGSSIIDARDAYKARKDAPTDGAPMGPEGATNQPPMHAYNQPYQYPMMGNPNAYNSLAAQATPKMYNTYGYKMGGDMPKYNMGGFQSSPDWYNTAFTSGTTQGNMMADTATANAPVSNTPPAPGNPYQSQQSTLGSFVNPDKNIAKNVARGFNPLSGVGGMVGAGIQNQIDDSTGWGKAAAIGVDLVSGPFGVVKAAGRGIGYLRDRNKVKGPVGAPRPEGPAPWEQEGEEGGNYSYVNNTRGYAWGSQDAGGMYGGGNPYGGNPYGGAPGMPGGGYGYTGQNPMFQSPYGNAPTAYGNYQSWGGQGLGHSSVPGQGYQPYYGAFEDGGDIGNGELQDIDGKSKLIDLGGGSYKVPNNDSLAHTNGGKKLALDGKSFEVEKGEILTPTEDGYNIASDTKAMRHPKIFNEIAKGAGFEGKFNSQADLQEEIAKRKKAYMSKLSSGASISDEEKTLYFKRLDEAEAQGRREADNLRLEEELQSGKREFKIGGNLSFLGGKNKGTTDYTQDDWYQGFQSGDLGLDSGGPGEGYNTSNTLGYDPDGTAAMLAGAEGGSSASDYANWAQKAKKMLNFGERQYGKYGTVNTQNYLEALYGKGFRLAPGRFNPFGGKAMQEISESSGKLKRAADQSTEREHLKSRKMRDRMKNALKFLTPSQYAQGLTAADTQEMDRAFDIEDNYIDRQAMLSTALNSATNQAYNIAGMDTNELRRLDQMNQMSEANWDQTGLMLANARDNRIQGIGQNAYNEYYLSQGAPYGGMGMYSTPWQSRRVRT